MRRIRLAQDNMHCLGSLIFDIVFDLSRRINEELLRPMSRWLDDPDWLDRFRVYEDRMPNWAEYKRKQRHWKKHQRLLMAERLRRYWQAVRNKGWFF